MSAEASPLAGVRWVVLSDGARPTEDIYFLESAAPALRQQGAIVERFDTRRYHLPTRWALRRLAGANLLIVRSLGERWVRLLERHRERLGRIVYLIDDDLGAVTRTAGLPVAYVARLSGLAMRQPALLALADEVVACCEALVSQLGREHANVSLLTPPMLAPATELADFTQSDWTIGYHGTRAHRDDIAHLAPALTPVMAAHPQVRLEIMMGRHVPESLSGIARLETPEALPWKAFQQYQATRRIQIGLAPLLETPFNRGKSWIKFLDIVAMGGVGIYSRRAPYDGIVEHGVDGLLVGDDPSEWRAALEQLLADPTATQAMAERALQKARDIGAIQTCINFWSSR
ncbi:MULTISPECIES: glycosyltransferase [Cobetia]|uniref:glycosyltransferase family protein n=1 Tax=Cobetia TaxID=204286 RepID=UPI0015833DC6|nr:MULTISPECIES: glycosyltransferase [Cobetia]MDI4661958.1 glycosyltransferase [Cobetia sp. BMC6]NUJ57492.1 glycosyltransferase [Cobetia marina]